ncbi:MAG: flagellar hook protein FlgE [Nitrospirae bacterium]|nr:flagellar hook protein FlgE [Nitrospirota bacterium]MBI3594020.1 flagellar hook protein FlgE [Nitrospirota bacterium]
MAILSTLSSGVSGLNAYGEGLSVVGNNIANMNTAGFKDGSASFADIVSSNLAGGTSSSQVGRGVFVDAVTTNFGQGSFETTSNGLNLAVDGSGMFLVADAAGAVNYTRNGTFQLDKNGMMVNPEGLFVQGYQANAAGVLSGQLGSLNLGATAFPPLATANLTLAANLNSSNAVTGPFVLANASQTSNFSTGMSIFDSLGNSHQINFYFTKTAANTWAWNGVVNAADSVNGIDEVQARGTLSFNSNGALTAQSATTYLSNAVAATGFNFSGGATANQAVTFNFGTPLPGGTGLNGITQFAGTSAILNLTQDGYATGSLESVSIGKDGTISGLFTNGKNRTLGQVALARFNSPEGLSHLGNNLFGATADSGAPIVGTPAASGLGTILAGSLELSNVDLAEQFTKMIEFQRGFDANSKVITTTDDMLQTLVNIKR